MDESSPMNAQYEQEMYDKQMAVQGGSLNTHMLRNPPVRKILEMRLAETRTLAKAYEDAIAALDENPNTEKLLNALRKLGI